MKVRIENNKNIQKMEQKDINIYEILKGVEYGTELYTPMCGNVVFTCLPSNNEKIRTEKDLRIYRFDKNGRWMEGGEVMLFPSNEMRDWSKFFKKGDVLFCYEGKKPYYTIFDGFENNTYQTFNGKFAYDSYEDKWYQNEGNLSTITFHKLSREDSEIYITKIEERFGGKLNRETLEIEKPEKLKFEIGKLYVFREEDEDGELAIIGELIAKNESEDTENEVELFNKHYAIWKKEKEAKEHRTFKPFDKVLVRSGDNCKWLPALFIRDRGVGFESRHTALPIHSGEPASFAQCISYDGNEYLAFTSDPF